jgi:hypothetical protein
LGFGVVVFGGLIRQHMNISQSAIKRQVHSMLLASAEHGIHSPLIAEGLPKMGYSDADVQGHGTQ